jgi:hypothetical protein
MDSDGNKARAAGAAQASGPGRATTVLVALPEWATAEDLAVAYPALGDEQIEAFRRFGVERTVAAGEVLFRPESTSRASAVIHSRVDDLEDVWPGVRA